MKTVLYRLAAVALASAGMTTAAVAATYKDTVLADNPMYYWTFDEPSGNAMNYGSGEGGILVTNAAAVRIDSAYAPNGLWLGKAQKGGFRTDLSGGSNLTQGINLSAWAMEFWFKAVRYTASGSGYYALDAGNGSQADSPSILWDFAVKTKLEFYIAGQRTGEDGPAPTLGQWHHVVIGFKDGATTFIVDNGTADKRVSTNVVLAPFPAVNGRIALGSDKNGTWGGGNVAMDEVAIYDLSGIGDGYDAKLERLAGHSASARHRPTSYKQLVMEENPDYYWTFDESAGAATNYGYGTGGLLVPVDGARAPSTVNANGLMLGYALQEGYRSSLSGGLPLNYGLDFTRYAIEFWIKPVSAGQRYLLSTAAGDNPSVFWDWPGVCPGGIDIYTAGHKMGPLLETGQWRHIVIGYDGIGLTTFYTNGVRVAEVSGAGGTFKASNAAFALGCASSGTWGGTNVVMDEVALYDLTTFGMDAYSNKLVSIASHSLRIPSKGIAIILK